MPLTTMNTIQRTRRVKVSSVQNTAKKSVAVLVLLHLAYPSYTLQENNTQDPEYETIAPKYVETRVPEDGGAQGMTERQGGGHIRPCL